MFIPGCGNQSASVSAYGWDAACNASQLCYTTCGQNKTFCDFWFFTNLTNACALLPNPTRNQCLLDAKKWDIDLRNVNATQTFESWQSQVCSCYPGACPANTTTSTTTPPPPARSHAALLDWLQHLVGAVLHAFN